MYQKGFLSGALFLSVPVPFQDFLGSLYVDKIPFPSYFWDNWSVTSGRWVLLISLSILDIREGIQKREVFFGISFPNVGGWGGWFPNKVQTPQNPPNHPAFFDPHFTFRFPKSHRNPGVGGLHIFGKTLSFKPSLMRYRQNSCYQVTWFRFPHLFSGDSLATVMR